MVTIERVSLEVGGLEGTNSAYVLPDHDVLIDPGPYGRSNWQRLRTGIEESGTTLADIQDVLVTHWHVDHAGLAPTVAAETEATLWMHAHDAPLVASYASERERRLELQAIRMREWGVPEDRIEDVQATDQPTPLPDETPVETVVEGDSIAGLDVIETPGHTLGHTAFQLNDHLFVGDAVLETYTPNVGGGDLRMDDPLALYLKTLDRIQTMNCTGHPGHGTTLNLKDRVAEIREHHRQRKARVLEQLSSDNPVTPWSVAENLFGKMEKIHVKMGAGEAAAHLIRLDIEGTVERVNDDPRRYCTK